RRVDAVTGERAYAAQRARGQALEAAEHWGEALRLYESVLRADRSLAFAQQGKARAAARLKLGESLQTLIDRPDRLASPEVRRDITVSPGQPAQTVSVACSEPI